MHNVQKGSRALWRTRIVDVVEVDDRLSIVMAADTGEMHQVPTTELSALTDNDAHRGATELTLIQPEAWSNATALAKALHALLGRTGEITQYIREAAATLRVSERTIWRHWRKYQASPLTTTLLPAKPGRRQGCRVLDVQRELLIAHHIETFYLRPERPTVSALTEEVAAACRANGLRPPSTRTIAARVKAYRLDELLKRREGSKTAKETCTPVPGHVEVTEALERVEIDHTLVDVILRDETPERSVIGRPWLTLAIDCATRMVLGYWLSFSRPSAASVAMCLAQACLPKDKLLAEYGIDGDWPAEGKMTAAWVDNAKEFDSLALRRGCEQVPMSLCFRPVGSPEIGGMIERLIGTIMGQVHLLPGTTQSNVQLRGDYDAEASATMTLREFAPWLTEQIVTQYHLKEHRGIGTTPLLAWREAIKRKAPKPIAHPMEFLASFLPGAKRKLTRIGVEMHTQTYWCERMRPWVGRKIDVMVTYHPVSIRMVYVRLPDGSIAEALNTRTDVPDVSVAEWRRARMWRRFEAKSPQILAARDKGRLRNRQREIEAAAATRKALREVSGKASAAEPPVDPIVEALTAPTTITTVFTTIYLEGHL